MQAKNMAAKAIGLAFLAVFFIASLGSLFLLTLPGDVNSLESQVNREWTDRLAGLVDLAFPQLKDVTLDEVKFGCMLRSGLGAAGIQNPVADLPLSSEDLDFICSKAGKVTSMDELKYDYISLKFGTVSAEAFSKIRKDIVEPYTNSYLPVFIFASVICLGLSCICVFLGEGNAGRAVRTLLLGSALCGLGLVALLAACWLAAPSFVEGNVRQNPDLIAGLALIPKEYTQFAEIAVSEVIAAISQWAQGIIVRFILVYISIASLCGVGWAGLSALARFREEEIEGKPQKGE
ncbi:MAG: hypothetical protein PHS02_03100 [Candidatus ainarchaeum sp.]|nr:hypothetical protein [Candidatus ainarchaeum sp.]